MSALVAVPLLYKESNIRIAGKQRPMTTLFWGLTVVVGESFGQQPHTHSNPHKAHRQDTCLIWVYDCSFTLDDDRVVVTYCGPVDETAPATDNIFTDTTMPNNVNVGDAPHSTPLIDDTLLMYKFPVKTPLIVH